MTATTFAAFEAQSRAAGFTEVVERYWPPGTVLDTHTHDFALDAVIVAGDMWLTVGDDTRYMHAGDCFSLDAGVPHAERYGIDGTTYWVARRTAAQGSAQPGR